jgi:hypothetical protein
VWPISSTLGRTGTVFCPLRPPFRATSGLAYRWNRSDLKKLTTPVISDDLLLTLWKNRLPNTMWTILSLAKITSANDLTMMTQRIHEAWLEEGRLAVVSARNISSTQRMVQQHDMREARAPVTTEETLLRIECAPEARTAVGIDHRRGSRSCSRYRSRRFRSSSREREQQTGLTTTTEPSKTAGGNADFDALGMGNASSPFNPDECFLCGLWRTCLPYVVLLPHSLCV